LQVWLALKRLAHNGKSTANVAGLDTKTPEIFNNNFNIRASKFYSQPIMTSPFRFFAGHYLACYID
jgi:hypothetical protein